MISEEWRAIPGYEGRYEVSNLGRVRSLTFRGNGGLRIMRSPKNYAGYHVVTLGLERKQHRVHCLVLEAFVGPRPTPAHDGCHGPGGKDDNSLNNLRWGTKSENCADRRSYRGQENPNAKITDEQVDEICERYVKGTSSSRILAQEFGITRERVIQIARAEENANKTPEGGAVAPLRFKP